MYKAHKQTSGTWFKQNPNFKVAFMGNSKLRKSQNKGKDESVRGPVSFSQGS